MKKALVTGGAGFIGGHIVDALLDEEGWEVTVVDNCSAKSNDKFHWRNKAVNHRYDICNNGWARHAVLDFKPDYIFHLAAETRIMPSIKNPKKACETNFLGTCNVLEAAREIGARVIYSSTSSAYGLKNKPPLNENMSRDCLNPYSVSKVAAEDLCRMYYTLYGVEVVTFRYFNVYGNRQPQKGQYAPVIGIFLRQKNAGEDMTITGDGEQRRDFCNVKDVVRANILAAKSDNKDALGEIFNIGSGTNHSVLEISKMIDGSYKHIPPRPAEAKETLADISKAERMLGWTPKESIKDWINENK